MKLLQQKKLTLVLFSIYLLLLVLVVLFKLPFYSETLTVTRAINLIPFAGSYDESRVIVWSEIAYNMLLFVPLGIYICVLKSEWPFLKKIAPIICLTLAFEVIQFAFAIGITDITDIMINTFGGIIGIAVFALLFKIFKNKTIQIINTFSLAVTICIAARFCYLYYLSNFVMAQ